MVVRSVREGARVTRGDLVYLGRVVDRARGIYRSGCQGSVPLRPGDGQVQAHAGGRREAEEARRPHLASLPPTSRLTTRVNGGEGIIQTEASELFQGFRANTIQNQYLPGMGWRHR